MNIFVLDINPKKAAEYHCDKHVVKMVLESCQMLIAAYYKNLNIHNKKHYNQNLNLIEDFFFNSRTDKFPRDKVYGIGYINHPCTVWSYTCIENWKWLLELANELSNQYTIRYNKIHKCQSVINWFKNNIPNLPSLNKLTEFALAMPDIYKKPDAVASYVDYYRNEKMRFATWKFTEKPYFI